MQTFTHNGVTITCDASAVFHAEHGGAKIEASSLAAIKKKLDKPPEFTPFDAPCRVIGKTKVRSGSWRKAEWKLANGQERSYLYADTPENRLLLEEQHVMANRHDADQQRNREEARQLAARIIRLHPEK